mgnify:CR=1 FL=1
MNIFLSVYACEPNNGSEPEVGWQMVNQVAKLLPNDNIYALTKKNNKEKIETLEYPKNIQFIYYAPPKWLTFWKKGGRGIRTYYYLWSIGAELHLKKKNIHFDIVHHITFVNDWLPSFNFLLKNKNNKFIWGPIGSHDPIERKFLDGTKKRIVENIRILLQKIFRNFDPFFYFTKNRADCIIGINKNVANKLNLSNMKKFLSEPAIGIEEKLLTNTLKEMKNERFTIISVGRLIYIKNFKLSILSFAKFLKNNPTIININLQIIGEGSDKKELINLAKKLNVLEFIEFTGNIPLKDVQEKFAKANLFLFPTLENAGFVTLEAMTNSLPILAMRYGGPEQFVISNRDKQLVNSTLSYEDLIQNFSEKIEYFYNNPSSAEEIGNQNKLDVLNNFTWEAKAKKMVNLYKELLDEKN